MRVDLGAPARVAPPKEDREDVLRKMSKCGFFFRRHKKIQMSEPLLVDDALNRFCLFPIKNEATFEFYLKAVASFWTVSEVDMGQDVIDFKNLTADEQKFVTTVLAFFAGADGIVNENLAANFATEVTMPEARQFYSFQQGIETIHAHMYGLMIDTIVPEKTEKERLFRAIGDVPVSLPLLAWRASSSARPSVPSTSSRSAERCQV